MTGLRPEDLIDLARYPLHEAEGAGYLGLLRAAQGRLAEDGALVLPGFVTPAAVAAMVREAEALLPRAYYCAQDHNPYLVADDPDLPPAHPRNRPQTSDKGCIAHDLFAEDSALRAPYDWPPLRAFIAAVQGVARLYPYEDPLASLNLNVFAPGQQLGWHFDNLRNPEDANYDAVARVLDGERAGVRVLDMDPGALVLFRGRYALHRVTPVEGTRPRLLAILSYDPEPGKMLTEHTRALFYGRVA
jgi:hypothetical protein